MWARRTSTFFFTSSGPGSAAEAGRRAGPRRARAAAEQVRGTCTREGLNDILQYPRYFKLSDLPKEAGEGFIDLEFRGFVVPIAHIETEKRPSEL